MACKILRQDEGLGVIEAFYCSTTDCAFGPIMYGDAEEFMEWLDTDPRKIDDVELISKYNEFRAERTK